MSKIATKPSSNLDCNLMTANMKALCMSDIQPQSKYNLNQCQQCAFPNAHITPGTHEPFSTTWKLVFARLLRFWSVNLATARWFSRAVNVPSVNTISTTSWTLSNAHVQYIQCINTVNNKPKHTHTLMQMYTQTHTRKICQKLPAQSCVKTQMVLPFSDSHESFVKILTRLCKLFVKLIIIY